MTKTPDQAHAVDIHVGRLIRARRRALGLSQTDLATALGITFQQVQKYERGANRISASKLYETAQTLQVEISSFFEGLATLSGPAHPFEAYSAFLEAEGSADLAANFLKLPLGQRRRVAELVAAMAEWPA